MIQILMHYELIVWQLEPHIFLDYFNSIGKIVKEFFQHEIDLLDCKSLKTLSTAYLKHLYIAEELT